MLGIRLADKPHAKRDKHWGTARKEWLKEHPTCAACGGRKHIEVHHLIPVHVDKRRELDPTNLMTLCRLHHEVIGHFSDWYSWNSEASDDARFYLSRYIIRPRAPIMNKG